ncbi:hypothetical protein KC207_13490 [Phycicoccus sp. BSK3Z-2]|uniref:Lipase n=1 Tax=Phycicoccus avicenniae TaxID=2828860 RepID=A0A941DC74_9MICO|nr:hypothetical protein [Phycicoccus avicenniae]MBR7744302.1 hypothetical protein [Phycicoccus avicenniae]
MSPRRRAAVLGLVLLVLLAAGGLVLLERRSGASAVAQDRPGTVLLVPGYGGGTASLQPLATALRASGREVEVVEPEGDGTGDLRRQADALAAAADAALAAGAPSVDVVGYSAGGVVARVWAAEDGGADRARRVVTLGSPHHGTDLAGLGAALGTGACPPACRQLAPGSDLLASLPETPAGPRWVSVWTADDETVVPPDTAVLDGALDVEVQAVCPDARTTHGELPRDPLVVAVVLRALAVEPLGDRPAPDRCDALRQEGTRALSS